MVEAHPGSRKCTCILHSRQRRKLEGGNPSGFLAAGHVPLPLSVEVPNSFPRAPQAGYLVLIDGFPEPGEIDVMNRFNSRIHSLRLPP